MISPRVLIEIDADNVVEWVDPDDGAKIVLTISAAGGGSWRSRIQRNSQVIDDRHLTDISALALWIATLRQVAQQQGWQVV